MGRGLVVELKKAFCNKVFYAVILIGIVAAIMAFFNSTAWGLSKYWLKYMAGDAVTVESALRSNYTDMPLEPVLLSMDNNTSDFMCTSIWIKLL